MKRKYSGPPHFVLMDITGKDDFGQEKDQAALYSFDIF
jgi:hypothetical protein